MATLEDNAFDLAIVDPPFGLGKKLTRGGGSHLKFKNHKEIEKWDVKPDAEYFKELTRVSQNQIIWGGNYFDLPPCRGFLIWDKLQSVPNFSACEFAWSSIDSVSRMFRYRQAGFFGEVKIHPTQKPVDLYKWILHLYAKEGQRVLDTHLGSGSSAIAAHYFGVDFVGCELDEDYYDAACKRFEKETRQIDMFSTKQEVITT
jgi:site-specific DNA-methyltransferase (adenine-specific)